MMSVGFNSRHLSDVSVTSHDQDQGGNQNLDIKQQDGDQGPRDQRTKRHQAEPGLAESFKKLSLAKPSKRLQKTLDQPTSSASIVGISLGVDFAVFSRKNRV